MSVWYCIPSARPTAEAEKCLAEWRRQGYKIALWRDDKAIGPGPLADIVIDNPVYPGYALAVNEIIKTIFALKLRQPMTPEWFVTGGDDVWPDPNHTAEEIARQCSAHFTNLWHDRFISQPITPYAPDRQSTACSTFGVMQPTGDRFAGGSIDRICGSPWMGSEFCRRVNGGNGPLWPDYIHNFVDEELQEVAIKLGVLWQRPDLVHLHRHFQRASDDLRSEAVARPTPPHLTDATSQAHWVKYQTLFRQRKAAGFPGHEPIP